MKKHLLGLLIILTLFACKATQKTPSGQGDDVIEVVFLHMNDVYEIAPLEGGQTGGMARVATLRHDLLKQNPNTLTVHAGDFLSPSLYGTLKYEGKRIRGRQMVEVMNAIGVDVATFGNHEFDGKEEDLQDRLNESDFLWLGTNVRHLKDGQKKPFHKVQNGKMEECPDYYIWKTKDEDGTEIRVGIVGTTINSNPKDYVYYEDFYKKPVSIYKQLQKETDVVVGLTHLEMIQDLKLATMIPDAPLIMGGHDHDNMIDSVGKVIVAKADANVKSVYVHRLTFNKKTKQSRVRSELVFINSEIKDDPKVKPLVDKWENILREKIKQVTPEPYKVVYTSSEPLDALESSIRHKQTNMGKIIANAFYAACPDQIDGAFFNSGSIRIDDQLKGKILAIDIFRTLPFGGYVVEVTLKGNLLKKVLDTGLENKGVGGYLQWSHIQRDEKTKGWLINGKPLSEEKTYKMATTDFMLTGLESKMQFFTPDNPGIISVEKPDLKDVSDPRSDVRRAVIGYMEGLR